MKKVFYGFTMPTYSRSAIIFDQKHKYVECNSIRILFRALVSSRREQEIVVVSSPAHILAFFFRIATTNHIILDAGWPLSDSDQFARGKHRRIRYLKNLVIDFVAFQSAHSIIVESEKQNNRLRKKFFLVRKKITTRYTGVLERQYQDSKSVRIPELHNFFSNTKLPKIVLFRGKPNIESGIEKLPLIAEDLDPGIIILLVTHSMNPPMTISHNFRVINRYLKIDEIAELYKSSALVLGQLGSSPRINWTIPHKFFEAAYFGAPYMCLNSDALSEIVTAQEVIFISNSKPKEIAKAINIAISDDLALTERGRKLKLIYNEKISNIKLVEKFNSDYSF